MEDEGSQQKNEEVQVAVDHLSPLSCKKYIVQTFAGLKSQEWVVCIQKPYMLLVCAEKKMQLYLHLSSYKITHQSLYNVS
jgi:hypothetical protein